MDTLDIYMTVTLRTILINIEGLSNYNFCSIFFSLQIVFHQIKIELINEYSKLTLCMSSNKLAVYWRKIKTR